MCTVPSLCAEELSMLFHTQFMIPEGKCLSRERRYGRCLHPCYFECVITTRARQFRHLSKDWGELNGTMLCFNVSLLEADDMRSAL